MQWAGLRSRALLLVDPRDKPVRGFDQTICCAWLISCRFVRFVVVSPLPQGFPRAYDETALARL